jgi:hypothetical protein
MTADVNIKFISTVDGLSSIEECRPKPIQRYIPEWWKKSIYVPSSHSIETLSGGNFKSCPSFTDFFSTGYVIPMWADSIIRYDSNSGRWDYRTSDNMFSWDIHHPWQYLDNVPHTYRGLKSYFIFKAISPWKIITPDGYSVLQLPVFFDFNDNFSIISGVRDTDKYHNLNLQVVIHTDSKEIFIPRGTPIAHIFPYKRENTEIEVVDLRHSLESDKEKITNQDMRFRTKFLGSNEYINIRKETYKDLGS